MNETRRRPTKRTNYRLILSIGLAACLVLDILFLSLFVRQCQRAGKLEDEVKKLNDANKTLVSQNTMLQQQSASTLTNAVAGLPDPTTAQTDNLPDLIPQLTGSVYVVRTTDNGYQYLKIPAGVVEEKLNAFRDDAAAYTDLEGDAPTSTHWVLYADRVIGLAEEGKGMVSSNRTAEGKATALPSGFFDFVTSLLA